MVFEPPKYISYQDNELFLSLRPLEERDAEIIHSAVMLSIETLRPFMDWAHGHLSVKGQLARIRQSKEAYSQKIEFNFSVFNAITGEFLMSATLGHSKTLNRSALSVGYWTSAMHLNKGLATLVTKILIIIGFEYMECDRVEIACNKANKQSMRVIEKCGFVSEGEMRNYFTEPTIKMIENGYHPSRTALLYSLIPQDIQQLSWFDVTRKNLSIER